MSNPIASHVWETLNVSRESLNRLDILVALILSWQKHINLIAPSTEAEIWHRHILDSAQLVPLIPKGVEAIADLGSGGGFPSLVLAAIQPAKIHMFESITKKTVFLQEALRQMKVQGQVHRVRLEERQTPENMPKVQLVTARAFAPLKELLGYSGAFFAQGATGLFHKGQDVDAEIAEAARSWNVDYEKHISMTDQKSVILAVKSLQYKGNSHE